MKRFSQGGDSPGPKIQLLADTDSDLSSEESFDVPPLSDTTDNIDFENFPSQCSSKSTFQFSNISPSSTQNISTPPVPPDHDLRDISFSSDTDTDSLLKGGWFDDLDTSSSSEDLNGQHRC